MVPARRIVAAGLTVGLADTLFAFVLQVVYAGTFAPARIFQGIASGVLGDRAAEMGATSTALGVALHFSFAFVWVLVYALAYSRSAQLRRLAGRLATAIPLAFVVGAAVWFGMNFIAKPIGGIAPTTIATQFFLVMTLGHGVVVGLPIVLLVRGQSR